MTESNPALTKSPFLKQLLPMVDFLGEALGEHYEVFLYDLTTKDHPILAIANGGLSGRHVGSLMRNVVVKILDNDKEETDGPDRLIRRDAMSRSGQRFKSSTLLIRDADGDPVGALCINFDVEPLFAIEDFIGTLGADISNLRGLKPEDVIFTGEVFPENRPASLETIYHHVLESVGEVDITQPEGRQAVVNQFYNEQGFEMKGAVAYLAGRLDVSEPSIYRYMNHARQDSEQAINGHDTEE